MTIEKLPSGSWRAKAYLGVDDCGKQHFKCFTDTDRDRAVKLATEYEYYHRQKNSNLKGTLEKAMSAYIASREPVLSPASIRAYVSMQTVLKTFFEPIMRKQCYAVSSDDIQAIINTLMKDKSDSPEWKKLTRVAKSSPKTVRNYASLISTVLSKEGYSMPACVLPQPVRTDYRVPTLDMIKEMYRITAGTDLELPTLLASCGMRAGEICSVTMSDFNFNNNTVHIHRSYVLSKDNKWILKEVPKTTASDRILTLPQNVMDKVNESALDRCNNSEDLGKRWRRFMARNGFPGMHIHLLRHFFASYLHSQGVPDVDIMKLGGWSRQSTLDNIYRNTMQDQHQSAIDKYVSSYSALF